jgi:transcription elongation GreA/GreB family factor
MGVPPAEKQDPMNLEQIKVWIAAGDVSSVESAWLEAMEAQAPAPELAAVLDSLVAAGQLNAAETCAVMLLEDRLGRLGPDDALELAKAVVSAVPPSDQLRSVAGELYVKVHGKVEHFEPILRASGLLTGQSPKRAFRTLDTCLAIRTGSYLANRFDNQVVRVTGYQAVFEEFEVADANGRTNRLDPKNLADEFDLVDDGDFRVLCQHRPEQLAELLKGDPTPLLIGLCQTAGGRIDAVSLKEMLVPRYIGADQWGDWWGRARTAAKRSGQLSLEGRSPIMLSYHLQGRTLEQELAGAAQSAKTPVERLGVLQQYLREARQRKLEPSPAFAGPIVEALAEQAASYRQKRPADALAAALAVESAVAMGLPAPEAPHPSAAEVLATAERPAEAIVELEDPGLWPGALDALKPRPDAAAQLETLLYLAPAGQLDEVYRRLGAIGGQETVAQAAAKALASPLDHLELFLWMWRGPGLPPANMPGKVELLTRILNVVLDLDHDWSVNPARAKVIRQRVRAALSASDYASYRQALKEMNESVAGTIKRLIERTEGLAEAVHADMLNLLREHFFGLFVKARIEPWLDENAIWTTEAGLRRREAELKDLVDVKMFANAKAIGAAAAHGDLSENSEWRFALEERDMLRARVAKMQEEIARARVLRAENVPADSVGIGSRVVLKRLPDGPEIEVALLGPWDVDPGRNVSSYQTPLIRDLLGKPVGATLVLRIEGEEAEYRVERLGPAL